MFETDSTNRSVKYKKYSENLRWILASKKDYIVPRTPNNRNNQERRTGMEICWYSFF